MTQKSQFYIYCTQWFLHTTEILLVVVMDTEKLGKGIRTIIWWLQFLPLCLQQHTGHAVVGSVSSVSAMIGNDSTLQHD